MKDRLLRLLPLLLLALQCLFLAANAQVEEPLATSSFSTTPPAASGHSPRSKHGQTELSDGGWTIDGAELVGRALSILRRSEVSSTRSSSGPPGLLGNALSYAKELLPHFYISGPPSDGPSTSESTHSGIRGPLLEGVRLLEKAADVDNADAIYLLAQMNFYGNFSHPRNFTEAFRQYSKLASLNGNSSAQHMIGFMYATGISDAVERDQAKALLYHTFAAEAGHPRAEMTVAFRHHVGIGTPRNCDEAVSYYKKAADKAMNWYRSGPPGGRAWVQDSYRIADEVGGVYGEGASASSSGVNAQRGGPNSDAHAALDDVLEYLDLMSRKGDFKATFSLGRIHYDGQKGLSRNMKKAKQYFHLVARQYWEKDGSIKDIKDKNELRVLEKIAAKAVGYLGRMYMRGEGVEQNYKTALGWYQRGVKNGDAGAQHGLGLLYLHGLAVPKNPMKAADLFKAAAEQDYSAAQVSLGALHLDQGLPSDIQIAGRYFEFAARYGHIEALYYLAELSDQGIGRERSCGTATAYYKMVAEKSEPLMSSFAEANEAFENGDYELALIDYLHAAEQGYEKGQANVAYMLDEQQSFLPLSSLLPVPPKKRPSLLRNTALALIYWTRSAKQTNIDSMVKMGDYYLNGIGTEPDMDKAAACYTAASEFHQSAQALYNLGWMHENGIGLTQDFHLAKRYYDQALETNDEAYLPVTLSLFKLRIRSAWNTLTSGKINSIRDEPVEKKQWSLSEWIVNFLQDDHPYYGDGDYDDDLFSPHEDMMPGGDELYDDLIDDGILETLIILGLAGALIFLVYYRQQRQLQHRRDAEARVGPDGQALPEGQGVDGGFFPPPGDPALGPWLAGGVGH